MSYTKGKWEINGGIIEVITDTRDYYEIHRIAVVGTPNMQTIEDTANARLIAAAPTLLEACIYAKERLEQLSTSEFEKGEDADIRTKIDLAIAQAESEE